MPANTGEAGAMDRVGFFAGMPAPTGSGVASQTVLQRDAHAIEGNFDASAQDFGALG